MKISNNFGFKPSSVNSDKKQLNPTNQTNNYKLTYKEASRTSKISFGQKFAVQDFLKSLNVVEFEISTECQKKCWYCYNSIDPEHRSSVQKFMDINLFEMGLVSLKKIGFIGKIGYHFNSEPLLHPNLEGFIAKTVSILPKSTPQIFTNGIELTLERLESLNKAGKNKIQIVLTTHDEGDPFPERLRTFPKRLLRRIDFKDWLNHPEGAFLCNRNGLLSDIKRSENITYDICPVPEHTAIVDLDGNVFGCYDNSKRENPFGNLHQKSFEEILISPERREFVEQLSVKGNRSYNPRCEACNRTPEFRSERVSGLKVVKELKNNKYYRFS